MASEFYTLLVVVPTTIWAASLLVQITKISV